MKVGIIGFGSIGKRHYENLLLHTKNIVVLSKRKDVNLPHQVENWQDFKKTGPYGGIIIANENSKHVATIKKCVALKPRALFNSRDMFRSFISNNYAAIRPCFF